MSVFKKNYSKIYDVLYSKKNYKLEVIYIINLLKKFNIKNNKILDLGCGSGKHLSYFIKKKYKVTGVEKNQNMIDQAHKNIKKNIIRSNIENLKLKKKYDIILCLFNVIGYFNSETSINSFFKTVGLHLKKNGVFIFDFWFSQAVHYLKPRNRIKYFDSKNFYIKKLSIPKIINNKIINIKFNFKIKNKINNINSFSFSEIHKIRHFSINELILNANKFNLMYCNSYSMLTYKKPSKKSWNVCAVFRKI